MKIVWMVTFFVLCGNVFGEVQRTRLESDASLQFLTHILSTLQKIDPVYNKEKDSFEHKMKKIMLDAHSLEVKWSRKDKKGKVKKVNEEELRKEASDLAEKALQELEQHLQVLQSGLQKNRESLVLSLTVREK